MLKIKKIMKKYMLLFIVWIIVSNSFSQVENGTYNRNFIRTFIPIRNNASLEKPVHNEFDYKNDWSETVMYFDGLGRPMQEIHVAGSPSLKDIIKPILYDDLGRVKQEYLPYAYYQLALKTPGAYRITPIDEQKDFYQTYYEEDPNYTFAERCYDGSPLNKVMKQGFAGEPWNVNGGATINYEYNSLSNSYEVYRFTVTENNQLKKEGCYSFQKLRKHQVTDENGKVSIEYIDLSNRTITSIVDDNGLSIKTMYVYDDLGLLRYVLPPMVYTKFPGGPTTITIENDEDWVLELCYYYEYDNRNRMIKKRLPGKEIEYLIYDNRNRLVLVQDGNQRLNNNWLFTKYDAFNRPVITGNYQNTNIISPADMPQLVNNETNFFETLDVNNFIGYTNDAFPDIESANCEVNTVYFYDNYNYYNAQSVDFKEFFSFKYEEIDFSYKLSKTNKGRITTSIVRIMPNDGMTGTNTDDWEFKLLYYDRYGNLVQSVRNIAFDGYEIISNKFNFTGQLLASRNHHIHESSSLVESISELQTFTYDHARRPLSTTHQLDQGYCHRLII